MKKSQNMLSQVHPCIIVQQTLDEKSQNMLSQLHQWIVQQTLDEKKSKHADLTQQNKFWPNIFAEDSEESKRHT